MALIILLFVVHIFWSISNALFFTDIPHAKKEERPIKPVFILLMALGWICVIIIDGLLIYALIVISFGLRSM